ncbi:prephenate dehydrogenase dimerization domain-containing protein [Rhodococcoides kyotonense]|uniref:Prephenate dehydrogenase n=1 Tax=Rhodococcoides kyotonense TaxID=398843 RepID=A0A239N9T5_9NOCA|nr:prephenate dehydrogenase dimerization domain-containing protein [Rhodococcus kyotonensis]SNT51242.1 prephenate dehydrogenase [Rhodococcus kyotonensis]
MTTYDAVVVGGSGAVGSLIAQLLASDGSTVLTVDRVAPQHSETGVHHVVGDVLAPDPELEAILGAAPIVVLAVPESIALQTVSLPLKPTTLLVETLSVKSGFAQAVPEETGPVLGINPMFAPSLGMEGRPVAAVTHRPGPEVDRFLRRIETWGARVVELDADAHDRLAAATQALTHAAVLAFGSALSDLGVDPSLVDAVAPPPARTLLALVARVSGGEPEVYWDVQAGNPYAAAARSALANGLRELDAVVTTGTEADFTEVMHSAGASVPNGDIYRALCSDLFGTVRGSTT